MDLRTYFPKSVYDPGFYKELQTKSLSFSFKYFYTLILALAVAGGLLLSIVLVPATIIFRGIVPGVLAAYPQDLVLSFENGTLKTNVSEPYTIPMPDAVKAADPDLTAKNLAVIDTKDDFSVSQFDAENTVSVLSKNELIFRNSDGNVQSEAYDSMPNTTIDKNLVASWESGATHLSRIPAVILALLIAVLLFAGMFVAFNLVLFYLLFGAIVVFVVLRLRGIAGGYKKAYQLSLHAVSLSLLVAIAGLFGLPEAPLLAMFVFLAIVFLNLAPNIPTAESI